MAKIHLKNAEILGLYILKDGRISFTPSDHEGTASNIQEPEQKESSHKEPPQSVAQISELGEKLKEKMRLLKESSRVNQERLRTQIRLLELAKEELESVCKKIIAQRDTLNTQVEKLTKKVELLERSMEALESENCSLKSYKDAILRVNTQLNEENDALREENSNLKQQIQDLAAQVERFEDTMDAKANMDQLLTLYHPSKAISNDIPYQSVQIRSLFELKQKGWKVRSQLREKIQELRAYNVPILSVVGGTGNGKSWFASQLSSKRLPFGWQHDPHSISSYYVPHEGRWFNILDASGWDELSRANENGIVDLISASLELSGNGQQGIDVHKVLRDDSRLIEDLKLFYMLKNANIVVFVSSKLTESDIERLYTAQRLLAEVKKQNGLERALPEVVMVHNFSWLGLIADVEELIKASLQSAFHLEKQDLFSDAENLNFNGNKACFRDQYGVTHLVIAAENTEAGNYYNTGAIRFLLSRVHELENDKEWSFCESFAEFCNNELKKALHHDFSLRFVPDDSFISATSNTSKIFTPNTFPLEGIHLAY